MLNNFFFNKRNVYEIMQEKYYRDGQATEDNIVYAHCMIDKQAANTHSEYVILITFPL